MISIIMAVYNTANYLEKAVKSVLAQTYTDWELLAIDDGSSDESGHMLDNWAKQDCRIRVFHTINGGLSAARNVGLKNLSGDYIQFLDSDDWLAPTALEEVISSLEKNNADMVIFDAYYIGMGVSFHERSSLEPGVYNSQFVLTALARPTIPPYACNKFCRSSLYEGVSFPVGEKWEDVATTFYPVSRANAIAVIRRPLYFYRQRADAITKKAIADRSIYKWRFLQYRKRYEFLKQNSPMIADVAKASVVINGLWYYAWFSATLTKNERKELYHFLCSRELCQDVSDSRIRFARFAFMLFPHIVSFGLKMRKRIVVALKSMAKWNSN